MVVHQQLAPGAQIIRRESTHCCHDCR
jgi:hypothetical protein